MKFVSGSLQVRPNELIQRDSVTGWVRSPVDAVQNAAASCYLAAD